ncbi:DotA/TraY family protein [Shigella flexneri]
MVKNYKNSIFIMMLLTLVMIIFTQNAHAADLFTVVDTDKSKLWFLDVLFPEDLSKSPLASTMTILNSAVLLVGGILAAYTLIAGTMSTAHDGEMLGKKWSSMWLPVRTALGTAMILPAAGGFCAAQVMVLWLITQGVGLANSLWNQYASNPSDGAVITTSASFQQLDSVAKNAFLNNVCMIKAQEMWDKSYSKESSGTKPVFTMKQGVDQTTGAFLFNYGVQGQSEMSKNIRAASTACGSISLENPAGSAAASANNAAAASAGYGSYGYMPKDISSEVSSITETHAAQFEAMNNAMAALAKQYVADNNLNIQAGVDKAVSSYVSNIDKAVRQKFGNGKQWDSFKDDVKKDGWIMAGAWNMKLIRIQDALNGAAHKIPSVGNQGMSYTKIANDVRLSNIMNKVKQDMGRTTTSSKYTTGLDDNVRTNGDTYDPNAVFEDKDASDKERASQIGSGIQDIANKSMSVALSGFLSGNVINGLKSGSITVFGSEATTTSLQAINPLLAMKSLGDTLTYAGWTVMGGAAGLGAFLAGTGTLTGNWVSGALQTVMVVMPIVIPLWMAGDTLSVILPMMPYIMWFGVTIGWMVLCLEAMIAAPLWVVVHLHPDGDGVVGRGGAGYSLVLSLTLRPALMILGLISAYTMLPILGGILNETFSGAFGMVAAGGYVGIVESLAVIGVYIGMMFMIVRKAFSLIHVVPDEIMKWLGAHSGQNMGGYAQSAAKGAEAAMFTQAALNQMSHSTTGIGNLSREAMGNKASQKRELAAAEEKRQSGIDKNIETTGNEYQSQLDAAGPIEQQDEAQSRQTATAAYSAYQAASQSNDPKMQAKAQIYRAAAHQAANRALGISGDNMGVLPEGLANEIQSQGPQPQRGNRPSVDISQADTSSKDSPER